MYTNRIDILTVWLYRQLLFTDLKMDWFHHTAELYLSVRFRAFEHRIA